MIFERKFNSDSTVILNGLDYSMLNNTGKDYSKNEKLFHSLIMKIQEKCGDMSGSYKSY